MKLKLLKPQRSIANFVLAYEDEDNYSYNYSLFLSDHFFCHDDSGTCQKKLNAGNCLELGTVFVIDGEEYTVSECTDDG